MNYSKLVMLYLSVSTLVYLGLNIMMDSYNHVSLLTQGVMSNFGIILGLYLLGIWCSYRDYRFSAYLTIFIVVVFAFTFAGAMLVINAKNVSLIIKIITDVVSLLGLAMSILTFIAAGKQRAHYRQPSVKGSK